MGQGFVGIKPKKAEPRDPSRAPDLPTPQPGLADVARRRAAEKPLPSRDISSNVRGAQQMRLARTRKMSR